MEAPLLHRLETLPAYRAAERLRRAHGALLTCDGLEGLASIGDTCLVARRGHNRDECQAAPGKRADALLAEVVGVDEDGVHLLPFDDVTGLGVGAEVSLVPGYHAVRPAAGWLGRVIDPLAQPLDHGAPLAYGPRAYPLHNRPLPAHRRGDLGPVLDLGGRAINLFTPRRRGQRMGIFAGSGVGKSTLLAMLARHARADALVLGLIGERGREVNAFLHDALGPEGRARSTVVVATSDMPAMLRRRAALLTLAVAEALRDQGMAVLCLIDSVTRYAMALREIHLAAGEPPTTKGYPPSVFAELPRLLERAGPGEGAGSITALATVVAEGDDLNDPVVDAVRAILDRHIVLDRAVADGGRFPAIDVLRSLSRSTPGCWPPKRRPAITRARRLMKTHADMAELVQLGACRSGTDPAVDDAIRARPALEALLAQEVEERSSLDADFARLAEAVGEAEATPQA